MDKKWYDNLKKSKYSPPDKVFGIVWPILYLLMIISFYLVISDKECYPYCNALNFFILQLILNLSWTTIFFKMKKIKLAFLAIITILILTVITFYKFYKINKFGSYLLIPYILWLSFASYLNLHIVINN